MPQGAGDIFRASFGAPPAQADPARKRTAGDLFRESFDAPSEITPELTQPLNSGAIPPQVSVMDMVRRGGGRMIDPQPLTVPDYNPDPPAITPEVAANERRDAAVQQLPLPLFRAMAESGQVNPNVGTLEDGPRPDPFGAVLGALPARGGVGRALRSGLVATAEGVVEPLANLASPLVQAAGGPDTSGAPEGLGAVFNATDPPQTPQERIGDVVGRIGSIPIQFAAMGGFNPVGAATEVAGGAVPAAIKSLLAPSVRAGEISSAAVKGGAAMTKLPAELAMFTALQQGGKVAAGHERPGAAAENVALSTPSMVGGAAASIPAALRAAIQPGSTMERVAGAAEAGEPALALGAFAGKDLAGSFLRRLIGGKEAQTAKTVPLQQSQAETVNTQQGGVAPELSGRLPEGKVPPESLPAVQPAYDAVNLTPEQIEAGYKAGLITDAKIKEAPKTDAGRKDQSTVQSNRQGELPSGGQSVGANQAPQANQAVIPPFIRKAQDAPPAQEAGPVAAAQEAGKVAAQTAIQAPPSGTPGPVTPQSDAVAAPGPVVYRETSMHNAILDGLIPGAKVSRNLPPTGVDVATTPDLALGQSTNKGIVVEFDASKGKLSPGRAKPGAELVANTGGGQEQMLSGNLADAVKSITVKQPDALQPKFERLLTQNGWISSKMPDGFTKWTKPLPSGASGPAAPAPPASPLSKPRVDTPARVQGELPAPGAVGEPERKVVGLSLKANAEFRKSLGMDDLPPAQKRAKVEDYNDAVDRELHKQAHDIAARAVAGEVDIPLKDVGAVNMGMTIQAAILKEQIETAHQTETDLRAKGDTAGADYEKQRAANLLEQANTISLGSRIVGTRTSQALSGRGSGVVQDTHEFVPVMNRAREANNNKPVPEADHAEFRRLTDKIKEHEAEIERLSKEQENRDLEVERRVAEELLKQEQKKAAREPRNRMTHDYRANLKKQLAALGHQVNVGLDPKSAVIVGKLAASYAAEGITNLKDNIKRVIRDVPDLTEEQVREAINYRSPKNQSRMREQAELNVASLKKQAELLDKIEKGAVAPTPRKVPFPLPEADSIKTLQKQVTELRKEAYHGASESKRLEKTIDKINLIQDDLANARTTAKKTRPGETNPDLIAAKAKLAELRKQMNVASDIADFQKQLDTGEYKERQHRTAKPIDPALRRSMIERDKVKQKVDERIDHIKEVAEYRDAGKLGKAGIIARDTAKEINNEMLTGRTFLDASATLRQGLVLSSTRPIESAKAWKKAAQSAMHEATAENIMADMERSPTYHIVAGDMGVKFDALEGALSKQNEFFRGELVKRIPGVKASQRHMSVYLNLLRKVAADQFIEANPNATPNELKLAGDFINKASGQGDLNSGSQLARAIKGVANAFFGPKFTASRFQTPWTLKTAWNEPRVRKFIAKDMGATLALAGTVGTLAAMAGAKVVLDPADSDWLKILVGNTRIDLLAGFQQPMRLVVGSPTNILDRTGLLGAARKKEAQSYDPVETMMRFASYKLNPMISTGVQLWTGKNVVGKRVNFFGHPYQNPDNKPTEGDIGENFLPMIIPDIYDAYVNGNKAETVGAGILSFLGAGVSTYEKKDKTTTEHAYEPGKTPVWWTRKAPYTPENVERRNKDIAKRKAREVAKAR